MKRFLKTMLVILGILAVFASCGDNTTTNSNLIDELSGDLTPIVENGKTSYAVVRAANGSKLESSLAVDLRKAITDNTGVDLAISNDSVSDPAEFEILVGKTNRQESQDVYANLKENEYVIKWVGKKLVIAGYDDNMMGRAYDFFINTFISGKTNVGVPKDFSKSYIIPSKEEQLSQNALVAYPEYPEQIKRDYDYSVTVTQGEKTITIPVYNETSQTNNTTGVQDGDKFRRFCEFAFSGDPVTVSVAVNKDMTSYLVAPSSKKYETKCEGNVISFEIKEPSQIVFKINGSNQSILSIFADQVEIEEEIPSSFNKDVLYYGPGWHDVDGDLLKVSSNKTLYVAPGAVLNARVNLNGDNIKVFGRGMIRDPETNRMDAEGSYVFWASKTKNVEIKDVKVIDGRAFSFVLSNVDGVTATNFKVLTNQISTDGISFFGACTNVLAENCFFHVTDNLFVFGGEGQTGITVKNCIMGADYALVYPQGDIGEGITFDNIDVFRLGSFIKNTQKPNNARGAITIKNMTFQNIHAMDIDNEPLFIYLQEQGNEPKTFTVKNVALRNVTDNLAVRAYTGSNYTFNFDNVWIGDKLFTSFDGMSCDDRLDTVYNFTKTSDKEAAFAGYRNEFNASYTAVKIKVGEKILDTLSCPAYEQDGKAYIAIEDLLKVMGYETKLDGTTLHWGKNSATVEIKDGVAVAPHTFLSENNIISAKYDASTKTVNIDNLSDNNNLLNNADFEDGFTYDWCCYNFTNVKITNDAHSGSNAMSVAGKLGVGGITHYVSDKMAMYGNGTYKLEAWVKLAPDSLGNKVHLGVISGGWDVNGDKFGTFDVTKSWTKITHEFTVNNIEELKDLYFFLGYDGAMQTTFYFDDVTLTKVN